MSIQRWRRCSGIGLAALAAWAGMASPSRAQIATVTIKSAGELLNELKVLARQADPASAQQILNGLDTMEATGAFNWLNRDKPITATGDLVSQGPGGPPAIPSVVLYVPITGQDDFLDGLKKLGLALDDRPGVEGFTHKIAPPGGTSPPAYLLANPPAGYAVLTNVPANPGALRGSMPGKMAPARPGSILVGLRLDKIPEQLKAMFLDNLKQRTEVSRARKADETDAQYKGRIAGIDLSENLFQSLVRDGREVTLDARVDEKSDKMSLAMGVGARPDSPMAKTFGSFGNRRGRFLNLWPDAAMTLQGVLPIPESIRDLIRKNLEAERARAVADAKNSDEDRKMIALVTDALAPTFTADIYDACVAMGTPGAERKEGTNVVLFGFGVKDAKKVEAALREAAAKNLKAEDRDKVSFDFARADDGTAIHRISLDPKTLKKDEFGDPYTFVAFPEGAAIAAVGGEGLGILKRSIANLGKTAQGSGVGPQVGLTFSATRFARLDTSENEAIFRQAAEEVFTGAEAAKDRLRIGLSGEAGRLTLAIDSDLPVIRFLGRVGNLQKGQ